MFPVICFLAGIGIGVIIMCLLHIGRTPTVDVRVHDSDKNGFGVTIETDGRISMPGKVSAPRAWPAPSTGYEVER